jgi:prefoldin subunit 5
MSIQVNKQRDSIENSIIILQQKIKMATSKQDDMRSLTKTISNLKSDQVGTSKLLYITKTETTYDKINTNKFTTTCLDCVGGFTCH